MAKTLETDLCVIGGGSGGLTVAAGAAQMGARVVLIEKDRMGGDCLNYGCVPSKALVAAAAAAAGVRGAGRFGVNGHEPAVDFAGVREHLRGVIAAIAPHDSVERFEGLGVTVLRAAARFVGPRELLAGDTAVKARRFVVAAGSSPLVPAVPGLDGVPYLTNETIFDLAERPAHLIVIGGGPIGAELAQAERRLGARVSVLEMRRVLGRDDPEVTAFACRQLAADGVEIHEGIAIKQVTREGNAIAVTFEKDGRATTLNGSHLLVAVGRKANVAGLGLGAAGVRYTPQGISVDARLRSSNRRIFAVGDIAVVDGLGGYQFTHLASYHAGIVLRNALFRLPTKVDYRALPRVTFTDPEIAQVGLSEEQARARHGDCVKVLTWSFADNDRAQTERATEGLVKVVVGARGRILGAAIAGRHAGELLQPWVLAIGQRLKIGAVANMIAPYPTLGEASKRAAGSYYTPVLFGERIRTIVRLLQKLG